jgi:hypothetical protein
LFKGDKRAALLGIANIFLNGGCQPLQMVPLSGRAIPRIDCRRFYFALTNFCNRSCELCCCHSDPSRSTHLPLARFEEIIACGEPYEAQLEGGEPLLHADFWTMVDRLVSDPNCVRITLCTNAVLLPWGKPGQSREEIIAGLRAWLSRFQGKPFVIKPSVNSHLIDRDPRHIEKMRLLLDAFDGMVWQDGSAIRFNVRRIPTAPDGERWINAALEEAGLAEWANDFIYQRIGRAEDMEDLQRPYIIPDPVKFSLISPDGKDFGCDLVERANYMKDMK